MITPAPLVVCIGVRSRMDWDAALGGATSWALSTCPPYVAAKIRQEMAASKYSAVFICKIWKKCIFHLLWRPLQRGAAAFAVGTHPIVVRLRQRWERKAESALVPFSFFEKKCCAAAAQASRLARALIAAQQPFSFSFLLFSFYFSFCATFPFLFLFVFFSFVFVTCITNDANALNALQNVADDANEKTTTKKVKI